MSTIASSIDSLLAGVDVERRRERTVTGVLIDDGHQLDDEHPVGVASRNQACELEADRGLADPAGPDEGDQAMCSLLLDELGEQVVPTDQRLQCSRKRRACSARPLLLARRSA